MRRTNRLKKYLIFMRSGFQTTIAYRGTIFTWFFGGIVNAVLMGLVWWAIYSFSESSVIGGFTFPQMLAYMIVSTVVNEVIYTDTLHEITHDVHHGLIGMRLMKPINYRAQLGFSAFGTFISRMILIGIPVLTIGTLTAVFGFGMTEIRWYNILLFFPACLLSAVMFDTIDFLFGQLAFRTHAMFGVSNMSGLVMNFLAGGMVPIALFPVWAQTALRYTPFPTLISFPVRIFLGQMVWSEMLIAFAVSIAWLAVLNLLAHLAYKSAVRHVVVFGG